jgi:ATP-dependent 26S proteasome regulatory subunit
VVESVKTKDQLLKEANELVKEMQDEFQRIGEAGLEGTTVLDIVGKYAFMSSGTYALDNNFHIGQNVLVYPRTGQVVEALDFNPMLGELFVIDNVKEQWAELKVKGERKLVSKGKFTNLKAGDVVLLDRNHNIVQAVIEHVKSKPQVANPVTWDMIGGNHEAKLHLREAIEEPYKYPDLYQAYTQQVTAGILLFGPPGTGKTLLGKASATSIGAEGGFISIAGPEVLDPYVGMTEANIRAPFARAKAYKQATGRPAVIFIDEAESLLSRRDYQHNYMGQTVVPTFLTEMNGIDDSSAIVILSTNRDDRLDPAVIREGRIDFKVEVKRPDIHEAMEIMAIHLTDKPIGHKENGQNLIEVACGELYSHTLPFSGALIAGTVNKAVTHALRRDTASGCLTGLSAADVQWATQQIVKQEVKRAA